MDKFAKLDTDNSGSIDLEELRAAAPILKISVEEVEVIFDEIDINGDGEISVEEFMAYFGNRHDTKAFRAATSHTKASLINSDVSSQVFKQNKTKIIIGIWQFIFMNFNLSHLLSCQHLFSISNLFLCF
jgi:hypothetical protein